MTTRVLDGIRAGRPLTGPLTVHVDLTNTCNAACVTCWDHSPLLDVPRSREWKARRLPWERYAALVDELTALGSVEHVILSGMGEPLTHPDVYRMIALAKGRGWRVTVLTNLVAADVDALVASGVDQVNVGVQGATPEAYAAFHPGWDESQFFRMIGHLRALRRAGVRTRHVQVIDTHTAPEVVEMVRFGRTFGADRVNFKLASLYAGTERVGITEGQRDWLLDEAIPEARALASAIGVPTNLDLFERQVRAARDDLRATVPLDALDCYMGFVYTRIAVDGTVLYCCDTEVEVGSLEQASFRDLWEGPAWQALRERIARREWFPGCDKCGKHEQNAKWTARVRGVTSR